MHAIELKSLAIDDIKILVPKRFRDDRGFFSETYNKRDFAEAGIELDFVQDNHSFSTQTGTVRGLHYQSPPYAQAKLVRAVRGAAFDVVVDIRKGSPTFGHWVGATISAENWHQILVPVGFAHGFSTLEPNTEIVYKASNFYSPEHDLGIFWNDPALAIDWPIGNDQAVLSERDQRQPALGQIQTPFVFGE